MTSISVSGLTWASPDGSGVLDRIDLQFSREKVGIVGRNGVGKSTLLNLIAGVLTPRAGTVMVDGTIWLTRQEVQTSEGLTIADLFGAKQELDVLERAAAGHASIDELAGADWTIEERIREALARVELAVGPETPIPSLSGGQRTRAGLAAAIYAKPDFLLLDEPTNNLDIEGRQAITKVIENWTSGLLVVSHDRAVLERMDAIVELTTLGAARYGGSWSQYRQRKAVELEAAEQDLAHAQKRQSEVERKAQMEVERRSRRDAAGSRKASRGDMPRILLGARKNAAQSSAGSGRRLSEKLSQQAGEAVAAARSKVEILQQLSIVLPSTGLPSTRKVIELRDLSGGYDPMKPLFKGLSLSIVGPERVAVVGPNGAGKSTFLKICEGELAPLDGRLDLFTSAASVDQHVSFLNPARSILENFRRLNPESDENACRAALAGFLFRADAALQTVGTLSGGQLLRAGLACRLGGAVPPQLLILDEPTNHLDLESISAIEAAISAYDGALLVVSHDESFLQNISITRRLTFGSGWDATDSRRLEEAAT